MDAGAETGHAISNSCHLFLQRRVELRVHISPLLALDVDERVHGLAQRFKKLTIRLRACSPRVAHRVDPRQQFPRTTIETANFLILDKRLAQDQELLVRPTALRLIPICALLF